MKKNIFSVIITALTIINVVLTAIMFFVMLPTFQKTNNLITQVASVLNLELDADKDASADEKYTLSDLEEYPVAFDDQQTLNLAASSDGKLHYAMLNGYTLSINTKAKDYKDVKKMIESNQTKLTDIVRETITSCTVDNISEDAIKNDALNKIQDLLDSKTVVDLSITNFMYN